MNLIKGIFGWVWDEDEVPHLLFGRVEQFKGSMYYFSNQEIIGSVQYRRDDYDELGL